MYPNSSESRKVLSWLTTNATAGTSAIAEQPVGGASSVFDDAAEQIGLFVKRNWAPKFLTEDAYSIRYAFGTRLLRAPRKPTSKLQATYFATQLPAVAEQPLRSVDFAPSVFETGSRPSHC